MKKNIKIFMFILILLLLPKGVYSADIPWNTSTSGSGGFISSCDNSKYCYSMMGLRTSLYKQSGSSATKVGRSHDYWNTYNNQNYPTKLETDKSGKSYQWAKNAKYTALESSDVVNGKKNGIVPTKSAFSIFHDTYNKYGDDKVTYLDWPYSYIEQNANFRSWLDSPSNSIISSLNTYDNLKKNLGLSSSQIDDVKYNKESYFLVFETLFGVWVGNSAELPSQFNSATKGIYYIGTLFDLNAFSTKFGGLTKYASALYLKTSVSNSSMTFVGTSSSFPLRTYKGESLSQELIKSNVALGLTVFKLDDVIKIQSCLDVCRNEGLSCYETFCDETSENSNEKKSCIINQCKYKRPSDLSCVTSSTRPNNKSCPNNTDSSEKTTCSTPSDYYLLKCTEKTNVEYSNDLPFITDKNLGGFNYSVKLKGTNDCTLTFNKDQFEFDYAALKRKTNERKKMEDYYPKTITINDYKITGNDYVKMQVNNDSDFMFNLKENSSSIVKSSSEGKPININVNYYGTGKSKTFVKSQTKNSSYSSLFELPMQCYSLKTGKLTDAKLDANDKISCDEDIRNLPYYGFYVKQLKTSSDKVTTKAIVRKESSGMTNSTNTCYYKIKDINDDFNCHIEIVSGNLIGGYYTGNVTLKYVANTGRNNNGSATYKFNNNTYSNINSVPQVIVNGLNSKTSKKVEGSITINGVTKACPITLNFRKVDNSSCKDKFDPVQFDAIRDYCNKNWKTDKDSFSSYTDCYNSCTGRDTCRTKYKCGTDRGVIERYCNGSTGGKKNYELDGYKSYEVCVNDCLCKDTNDYVYRPISLSSPFPGSSPRTSRDAGANWLGFEKLITEDTSDPTTPSKNKAEYVIELDEGKIKEIRKDTSAKGGLGGALLNYEGTYNDGVYTSKFIHKTFKNYFTCIYPSGSGCSV